MESLKIFIDTNIFINHFENKSDHSSKILQYAASNSNNLISSITVTEVLVKPIKENNQYLQVLYSELLTSKSFKVISIDIQISKAAAFLRAKNNINLADAMVIASAMINSCDYMISEDRLIQKKFKYDDKVINVVSAKTFLDKVS